MTGTLLEELHRRHAFDPAPLYADLGVLHVPFDELDGTGPGAGQVEARLGEAVRAGERAAVIGPSGCGKSSVMASTLGPLELDIAPILITVNVESDEIVTQPAAFAQHVVRTIGRYAAEQLLTPDQYTELLRRTTDRVVVPGELRRTSWGLPTLLGRTPTLTREVTTVVKESEQRRSGADIVEVARQALELFHHEQLQPVLVIDDTDAWLRVPGVDDRSRLIGAFFGRVLRMLAELPASTVLAVHESYLNHRGYRSAREGFIDTPITIPRLPDRAALDRLLDRRVRAHLEAPVDLDDVVHPDARQTLADFYAGKAQPNLRELMLCTHMALAHARTSERPIVTADAIRVAIAELRR